MGNLKEITVPNISNPLLAYETGIHIGDGSLGFYRNKQNKPDYVVRYFGNLTTDFDFFAKVLPHIIRNLYGLKPSIGHRPERNSIDVTVRSKKLFEFKKNIVGLVVGNKTQMKALPKVIVECGDESIRHLIAGLFDTDGCFKVTRQAGKPYPKITIANKSEILSEVKSLLIRFGIGCNLCKDRQTGVNKLDINGKKNVDLFFKLIPARNIKHLKRYKNWKSLGRLAQFG